MVDLAPSVMESPIVITAPASATEGIDAVEVIPAGRGGGRLQTGAGNYITGYVIAGRVAQLMLGHRPGWFGQEEADRQIGKRSELEGRGITDGESARRNGDRWLSVKGHGFVRAGNDRHSLEGLS